MGHYQYFNHSINACMPTMCPALYLVQWYNGDKNKVFVVLMLMVLRRRQMFIKHTHAYNCNPWQVKENVPFFILDCITKGPNSSKQLAELWRLHRTWIEVGLCKGWRGQGGPLEVAGGIAGCVFKSLRQRRQPLKTLRQSKGESSLRGHFRKCEKASGR